MATATAVKDHPEARKETLRRAGLSLNAELTPEQAERADEAPESKTGDSLRKFIMTGEGGRKKAEPKDEFHALAKKAEALAAENGKKLGSAITSKQARKVTEMLKEKNLTPGKAFNKHATKDQLLAYAQGGAKSELPAEANVELRDFCKESGDRRIWPRKVAALVLAMRKNR